MDGEIALLDYTHPEFQARYLIMLNRIDAEVDLAVLKQELVTYAGQYGMDDLANAIPANRIGVEGKIAYCLNRGANLAPSSINRIRRTLQTPPPVIDLDETGFEELPDSSNKRNTRAYVSCYSWIDNARTRVLKGSLSQRDLATEVRRIVQQRSRGKSVIVRRLHEHYTQMHREALQDPCISNWAKPLALIKETLGFMLNVQSSIKAGTKGARDRKMSSTVESFDRKGERAASRIAFKDEDGDLGIRSIDPTNLVGAEAAVVFNTKNRHCEIYLAQPGTRLSVQGARIVNFDESSSTGKTLRHPESDLAHWVRATNLKRLDVLTKGIKGKSWTVTGKLNKNCLIVKVL